MQLAESYWSLFRFHRYNQVAAIFTNIPENSMENISTKMHSETEKKKLLSKNRATQSSKNNLVRQKKTCLVGTFMVLKVPNSQLVCRLISTLTLQKSIVYRNKKTHKCQFCHEVLSGFNFFRLLKQKLHSVQSVLETKKVDVTKLLGQIDDESYTKGLERGKRFLVDSEMENRKHRVFNFAMDLLEANTSIQKLSAKLKELKCAAKLNVASGFLLKIVENGTSWSYYTQESNTLVERSELVATKKVLVKNRNVLINTDVIEACKKERATTKWKLYKLANNSVFAALLRNVPMG